MPILEYANFRNPRPSRCAIGILDPRDRDAATRRLDRRVFAGVVVVVLGIFAGLYNRWWVPGGDGDFYLVIARNIAAGRGIRFNGLRVAMEPPGWPILLAGALKISTSFAFLKCINAALLTIFLGISYWVVRRLVSRPMVAAAAVVATAILSNVYEISFWFHSDPFFCVLTAATFLAAFHVREGRRGWWRIPLLLGLCAASVAVRYAGLFNWPIVAGILLSGQSLGAIGRSLAVLAMVARNIAVWTSGLVFMRGGRGIHYLVAGKLPRTQVAALLAGVVLLGTWISLDRVLKVSAEEKALATQSGIFVDDTDRAESQSYQLKGKGSATLAGYFVNAGHWLSWLFFEPFRMAGLRGDIVALPIGFLALALLIVQVARGLVVRQWFWLGLAIPCLALFIVWSHATPRYLVAFAPLLLVGILAPLAGVMPNALLRSTGRFLLYGFIVAGVACNLALYGIEVWVFHQPHFYRAYYAGMNESLVDACHYLRDCGAGDNQIAVSQRYENMGRVHNTQFGRRACGLLTDCIIVPIPAHVSPENNLNPPPRSLVRWAHSTGVRYFLRQTPISPWRWHFSLEWLQRWKGKKPPEPTPSVWQLWDVSGNKPVEIHFPKFDNWPTHVPGL